ncbi:MAG: TonB-dependent receptor [Acidobacteriaceae bacterium]
MQLNSQSSNSITRSVVPLTSGPSRKFLEPDFSTARTIIQDFFLAHPSLRLSLHLVTLLGFCLAFSATSLHAQDFRASISGQVMDSAHAVIPGATITAVNVETRQSYTTTSDKQGVYALQYLLPGTYTVTVKAEAAHFQTMVYNKIILNSSQQMGLNVTLTAGDVAQQIVVTAGSVDLDTVSATTGGVVDQFKVENMPSTGMDVFDDVSFTQGIRADSANTFGLTIRNNSDLYAVAGSQTDESTYYVNGAPMSNLDNGGTWYFVPNQSAVQQVQASVMPYDAQYGRTGGGVFSVNIKEGSNARHGSIYDYYGNAFLNANTWIASLSHVRKAINIRNTFGAETGGPIRRNKMFYYGSYEGYRQDQPTVITESVPPQSWLTGNFTGSGFTIYDPLTTTCVKKDSSGNCLTYGRKEFPNNTIPASRISPIGQAIAALYPAPTKPGYINNYVTTRPTYYQYDQYIGRVDQNFTDNTRIYVLGTVQTNRLTDGGNQFTNAASTAVDTPDTDYNIITDVTHVVSSSMVLDLKGSYGHYYLLSSTGTAVQNNFLASALGLTMPYVGSTSHQNIVPSLTIAGMAPLFGNTQSGGANAQADISGSVTQLIGRHNLHYGAEFLDIQSSPTGIPGNPNGSFTFNSGFTQQNPYQAKVRQGQEIADLLLGYPAGGGVSWNSNTFTTMHYYGVYFQDNFRVLPTLSLNLGLRWDVNMSPRDRHNRMNAGFCLTCTNPYSSQVNYAVAPGLQGPMLGGLLFAGVNGAPSAPFQVFWNEWQPRIGFSWNPHPNMVVRGGYGIYDTAAYGSINATGFSQGTPFISSLDGNMTPSPYFNNGTPFPTGAIAPTGAAAGLATNIGNGIGYDNTNRRIRMTQHWSLGIQQRLPASLLLDIEYLGSTVHGIPVATALDSLTPAQQQACNASGAACNNNVPNPFYGVLPGNSSLGASSTIPAWKLMRPYPLFDGITENSAPTGDSAYNSLNVRVERRLRSLDFVFNYAWSNWVNRDEYLNNGIFRDANLWKGLDPSDQKNYVDANVVYPLPGIRRNGWLGNVVNGWLFDSTVIFASGTPLALPSATFSCASYAPQGGQTRAHWFNNDESCWTNLSTWQPRTTPLRIGSLRNPGYALWNAAVHKQFTLPREGTFLQFRIEALNAANHPTFGAPSLAIGQPAKFSPKTSWTGFGTLPTTSGRASRTVIASMRILF